MVSGTRVRKELGIAIPSISCRKDLGPTASARSASTGNATGFSGPSTATTTAPARTSAAFVMILVFAEDFDLVRNIFQSFKSRLRDESLTIVDFSRMCPLTLCTLDLGLPLDDDLVMANPFEEPDEYFLRRQKAAFGTETEVVM